VLRSTTLVISLLRIAAAAQHTLSPVRAADCQSLSILMQCCPLRCISSGSAFTHFEPKSSPETSGRWVRASDHAIGDGADTVTDCPCVRGSPPVRFCPKGGGDEVVALTDLASMIGFIYTAHVLFERDSDIRSLHMWELSPRSRDVEPSLRDAVTRCQPHPHLCVRYINDFMGYGLFADEMLHAGRLICEYTGLVKTHPSTSSYSVRCQSVTKVHCSPHATPGHHATAFLCTQNLPCRLCFPGPAVPIPPRLTRLNTAALRASSTTAAVRIAYLNECF
jgi:hypothetical protein